MTSGAPALSLSSPSSRSVSLTQSVTAKERERTFYQQVGLSAVNGFEDRDGRGKVGKLSSVIGLFII